MVPVARLALITILVGAGCGGASVHSVPSGRVAVPGGTFTAGLDEPAQARLLDLCRAVAEKPESCTPALLHDEEKRVARHVPTFAIDRLETSGLRYQACVRAGRCPAPDRAACRYGDGSAPTAEEWTVLGESRRPVVCVTFSQATGFCAWAGGWLPSEAEWERAARGDDGRTFPWGDEWRPAALNWGDDGTRDGAILTAPVGSYDDGASPAGALDLVGNVWEWARRDPELDDRPADGKQIIRGGGFAAAPHAQRVTKRAPYDPARGYPNVGFRCAYERR